MDKTKNGLLLMYKIVNHPAKLGRVNVTYERGAIDAAMVILRELMKDAGFEFKKDTDEKDSRS